MPFDPIVPPIHSFSPSRQFSSLLDAYCRAMFADPEPIPEGRPKQPSLVYLSKVLREGPTGPLWPKGLEWGYECCETCAIGVAERIWRKHFSVPRGLVAEAFNIPTSIARDIFFGLADQDPVVRSHPPDTELWTIARGMAMEKITPAQVADAIDAYLQSV